MKISISFLKSLYTPIETIKKIEETSADFIHVDIMDGEFVEEKTHSIDEYINLLRNTKKPLDIHLMMNEKNSEIAIDKLSKLKPDYLTIHVELENMEWLINKIKKNNIKVGIAINPETPIDTIVPYLGFIDLILIMSVHPGKGGQSFIPETIQKIQKLKEMSNKVNANFLISVDGGINEETVKFIKNYCDFAVSGSFVCMQKNYQKQINKLI